MVTQQTVDVWLDRDSVAAGDDTDSHLTHLALPPNATARDLIRRLPGFLPHVSGHQVAWLLRTGGLEMQVTSDGTRYLGGGAGTVPLAVLFVTGGDVDSISELGGWLLEWKITELVAAQSPEGYLFTCSYLSGGLITPWADWAAWAPTADGST